MRGTLLAITASALGACSLLIDDDVSGGADAPDGSPDVETPDVEAGSPEAAGPKPCGTLPACEIVFEGEDNPTDLVRAFGNLYWINATQGGSVRIASLDGGAPRALSTNTIDNGHHLAVTNTEVFAINGGGRISRFSPPETDCVNSGALIGAANGDVLFWADGSEIYRANCMNNVPVLGITASALAGDPPYLWFARPDGYVVRCDPTSSCATSSAQLTDGQGNVTSLAVDSTRVFWATPGSAGEVRTKPKTQLGSGTAPATLASGQNLVRGILPVGNDLFWVTVEGGTVMKAPVGGGAAATAIAAGLNRPWGIAATNTHVYVTESGAGRIVRIAR
jgi:hypothetical protein